MITERDSKRNNNKPWFIKRAEKQIFSVVGNFSHTIGRLKINEQDLQGDVAIIGQASSFPERVLVCQGRRLDKMKPGVRSLTCLDPDLFTNPEPWLDHKVTVCFDEETTKPISEGEVRYYPEGAGHVFKSIPPESYDAVTMFRISDLERQIANVGILNQVRGVLKENGIFTGSGSFSGMDEAKRLLEQDFSIEDIKQLPNPDYSGYPYDEHIGFVVRKR